MPVEAGVAGVVAGIVAGTNDGAAPDGDGAGTNTREGLTCRPAMNAATATAVTTTAVRDGKGARRPLILGETRTRFGRSSLTRSSRPGRALRPFVPLSAHELIWVARARLDRFASRPEGDLARGIHKHKDDVGRVRADLRRGRTNHPRPRDGHGNRQHHDRQACIRTEAGMPRRKLERDLPGRTEELARGCLDRDRHWLCAVVPQQEVGHGMHARAAAKDKRGEDRYQEPPLLRHPSSVAAPPPARRPTPPLPAPARPDYARHTQNGSVRRSVAQGRQDASRSWVARKR